MDRRSGERVDTGERRRKSDLREREDEWRLFRDKLLIVVGVCGVTGIAVSSVVLGFKDPAVALAALTLFGGLLGAPTILRLDERRRDGGRNGH